MIVTEVLFKSVKKVEIGVCAECSIILDNEVQIHNIKLIEGKDGKFLAFPHFKYDSYDSKYKDIIHPTNKNTRQYLTNVVISRYKEELNNLSTR